MTWFKSNSPAKGALLFALTFVVIGGSYMAYKSFAEAVWFTNFAPNKVKCLGNCTMIYDNHAKNPTYAARVNDNYGSSVATASFYLGHPWTAYPSYTFVPTRICATIRATNNTSGAIATIYWRTNDLYGTLRNNIHVPGNLLYNKYCTPFVSVPGGSHTAEATVAKDSPKTGSDIYVSSIALETP